MNTDLTFLSPGCKATVRGLSAEDSMRRRLQDIGLIEGTLIECVGKSPLGDPAAYLIRGTVIALRSADAAQVEIEPYTPEIQPAHVEILRRSGRRVAG